jgi:glycosyltransferase involved in cell wall biosynthesis
MQQKLTEDEKKRITVVIPTKNEEECLPHVIHKCREHCGELIVVDAHSTDRTVEIARAAGARIVYDNGKGKGAALRTAAEHVNTEIIVFFDADCSHDPADIPKLIEPILAGRADHVTGSRLLGGSSELHGGFDEFLRLLGSSFITALIGWRFKKRISDSQNGFRAIKTEVFRDLGLKENITTIEQEMIIKTLKKGYVLDEVPTHEHRRLAGVSKIRLSRVWPRYVYSMIKYLFF